MTRAEDDAEYARYAPVFAEYAALEESDPRRAGLLERLVVAHRPLARHVALRFARRGEPVDDLEQVAMIGLLHAIERYDPQRGRPFLAYAVPTIMGEVRRHFRDGTWAVRTPRAVKDRYVAVGAATRALSQELNRAPTVREIAGHLGLGVDEVTEAVAADGAHRPSSLDETLRAGGEESLVDRLGAVDADFARVEATDLVRRLLTDLPDRERSMVILRFVHEKTQSEIAEIFCMSQMHVSRLLARTLGQLRAEVERDENTGQRQELRELIAG